MFKTEKELRGDITSNLNIQHIPLVEELNLNSAKLLKKLSVLPSVQGQFKKRLNLKQLIQNNNFDEALLKMILFTMDLVSNFEIHKQPSSTPTNPTRVKFDFDRPCLSPKMKPGTKDDIVTALASQNLELTKMNQQLYEQLLISPKHCSGNKMNFKLARSARNSPMLKEEAYGSDSTDKYYDLLEKEIHFGLEIKPNSLRHHRLLSENPRKAGN